MSGMSRPRIGHNRRDEAKRRAMPADEGGGLHRDAVIEAALPLADEMGVEGLSMRALAERLGVKAASLYWHLRDKEQLLESLDEAVLDRLEVPVLPPTSR